MAPQRFRGLQEDSRAESSSTREKQLGPTSSGISKARRYQGSGVAAGSNLREVTAAASGSANLQQHGQESSSTAEKVFECSEAHLSRRFS